MPTLCRSTRRDLALLSALGCGSDATAVPGRPGALGHPPATLPQAVLTSSPALPSCGTPVLQLHHLFSSAFPLHFFWGLSCSDCSMHPELQQDLYSTWKHVSGTELGMMHEKLINIYTQAQ